MLAHRRGRDPKGHGDLRVGGARSDEVDYFPLPAGQPELIRGRPMAGRGGEEQPNVLLDHPGPSPPSDGERLVEQIVRLVEPKALLRAGDDD